MSTDYKYGPNNTDLTTYLNELQTHIFTEYKYKGLSKHYYDVFSHIANNYFYYAYDYDSSLSFDRYFRINGMTKYTNHIQSKESPCFCIHDYPLKVFDVDVSSHNPIKGLSPKAQELRELHINKYPELFI